MFFRFSYLFALTFFLPEELSVQLFGMVLLPYRVFLLAAIVPAVLRLHAERRFKGYDISMALLAVPFVASMVYNSHDVGSGIVSGGLTALETVGAYLVARAYLNSIEAMNHFADAWIVLCCVIWPILWVEAFSHVYVTHQLITAVTGLRYDDSDISDVTVTLLYRIGLLRAMGPFSHPILAGVAYAAFFSYAAVFYRGVWRIGALVVLASGIFVSISGTAFILATIAMALTFLLIQNKEKVWRAPLGTLLLFGVPAFSIANSLSNRGLATVLIMTLAFDPWTGYYRTLIWTYGMASIWLHPVFGIGYANWVRPLWMVSTSIDSYWLVIGIRHGVIAFAAIVGISIAAVFRFVTNYGQHLWSEISVRRNAAVWAPTFIGISLGGLTVDYWGPLAMIVPVLLAQVVSLNERADIRIPAPASSYLPQPRVAAP